MPSHPPIVQALANNLDTHCAHLEDLLFCKSALRMGRTLKPFVLKNDINGKMIVYLFLIFLCSSVCFREHTGDEVVEKPVTSLSITLGGKVQTSN